MVYMCICQHLKTSNLSFITIAIYSHFSFFGEVSSINIRLGAFS